MCERVSETSRWRVPRAVWHAYRDAMAIVSSPEIESVVRRALQVYAFGEDAAHANLFSSDPSLRVLGSQKTNGGKAPKRSSTYAVPKLPSCLTWDLTSPWWRVSKTARSGGRLCS
jgi:hypothetical protein